MKNIYLNGTYLKINPTWHIEDSERKSNEILSFLKAHDIKPTTICEIGCGAGEILKQLSEKLPSNIIYSGYEISPQAIKLCKDRENNNLHFYQKDFLKEENAFFDILLAIDVFEHLEDYIGFLKVLKNKGRYKIFRIPLDISVNTVLRGNPIIKARKLVGHIHYFTKEVALATLQDAGYHILDYKYNPCSCSGNFAFFKKLIREFLFALNQDFTVRILGGFSILVMCE